MGSSAFGVEGVLQAYALPSRRDYQLRSCSFVKASDEELSTTQSPWVPRSQYPTRATTFRFEQMEGPTFERPFYSGPLPSLVTADEAGFFSNRANSFHRQQLSESSLPGTPEVGSSRDDSFREPDARASENDDEEDSAEGESSYVSYMQTVNENSISRKEELSPSMYTSYERSGMRPVKQRRAWSSRNCVSGELSLGMGYNLPRQRSETTRRCVSGEIGIVNERAASASVSEAVDRAGDEGSLPAVGFNRRRPSASIAWDSLNDLNFDSPGRTAAVPFMWEEAPGKARVVTKKLYSRTSSSQSKKSGLGAKESQIGEATGEPSLCGSHRYFGAFDAEKIESPRWSCVKSSDIDLVAPAAAKFLKEDLAVPTPPPKKVVPVAVPFKWEEVPGKPKFEDDPLHNVTPALQLPPRLASSSLRHEHPSSRNNGLFTRSRARTATFTSLSAPFAVLFPNGIDAQQSLDEVHCYAPQSNCRQTSAVPWRDSSGPHSGPISHAHHFGLPQYQSPEALCEKSHQWNPASPTSTLNGPGTARSVPSSSLDNDNHKSLAIVPFSSSQSSTSHESFEQWSYWEQVSPNSRYHSVVESEPGRAHGSPYLGPMKSNEDMKSPGRGAIEKLCKKLKLKTKTKPDASPTTWSPSVTASPRFLDLNAESAHGEEFFECRGSSSSSPLQNSIAGNQLGIPQLPIEGATRLPYKMPPVVAEDIPVQAEWSNSSGRGATDFSGCLGVPIPLPRFLSKCETVTDGKPSFWVENPSWDPPSSYLEDGYRSPAYRATLDLLSPSEDLMAKSSGSRRSRSLKLANSSLRRRQMHLVEVLRNSLRHTLLWCTKQGGGRTNSVVVFDDQFSQRRQSYIW